MQMYCNYNKYLPIYAFVFVFSFFRSYNVHDKTTGNGTQGARCVDGMCIDGL